MRADINTSLRAKVIAAFVLTLLLAPTVGASAPDEPYRVLVLHSFRNSLPANADWYNGVVRGFASAPDLQIETDIEAPELTRFWDEDYVRDVIEIYRRKYRDHSPHLIIPTYTPALQFLLDHGDDLFPGSPIVFCGVDSRFVAARKLAAHITGVTLYPDIAGTLELALHVHPDTRRVAVIAGSGTLGRQLERDARQAFQAFEGKVEFTWLKGMPLRELTAAVSALPGQSVILYLAQLEDRDGKPLYPLNTIEELATAANVPIYGLWDTLIGHGVTGGRMATLENDGFQVAQMAVRILKGEAPAAVPVIYRDGNAAIFHGGELARWNIDEDRLPAGSRVLYRPSSIWREHRTGVLVVGLVVGIQALLISVLLLNRARLRRSRTALRDECKQRSKAEALALGLQSRLAKFSKERSLGTMATSIAHEINQPLIAIQNYAQAANRRAQSPADQKPKLNELFDKIERQAGRAGEIIQRIRTLVATSDAELHPTLLDSPLEQVVRIMKPGMESQGFSIDYRPAADRTLVLADPLQIQLVMVNLLQNAMHSLESAEEKVDKVIRIETGRINDREERVSVTDRGPGIPPDEVESVFEPLYSGRGDGMGMGLAICRTIVDAHGGRVWYTPHPSGGAIFQFTLPLAAP